MTVNPRARGSTPSLETTAHIADPSRRAVHWDCVRAVLVLLLIASCDRVLGLQPNPIDGAVDGTPAVRPGYITPGDYDLDGRVNGTDPCPMFGGAGEDDDPDGDGVGAACDPNEQVDSTPNCILIFDTFTLGEGESRWSSPHSWSRNCDGDTYLCSPPSTPSSFYIFDQDLDVLSVGVEAKIAGVVGVGSGVFVMSNATTAVNTVTGRGCGIVYVNTQIWALNIEDVVASVPPPHASSPSDSIPEGTNFGLRWVPPGLCRKTYAVERSVQTNQPLPAGARVALFTNKLDARIKYLVAYGVGDACIAP